MVMRDEGFDNRTLCSDFIDVAHDCFTSPLTMYNARCCRDRLGTIFFCHILNKTAMSSMMHRQSQVPQQNINQRQINVIKDIIKHNEMK